MSLLEAKYMQRPASSGQAQDTMALEALGTDELPHLRELELCLSADFVHIDNKYGHFTSIPAPHFPRQVFPTPVSDSKQANGDVHEDDEDLGDLAEVSEEHLGGSPAISFDPVFNWNMERAAVVGHRLPIPPLVFNSVGMRFSVSILSMTVQTGLVEPFYGTICLYHMERREKVSEDFYFQIIPPGWPGPEVSTPPSECAIFTLDAQSPTLCLLVQLEKAVAEEGPAAVKTSVYTRKDPMSLSDKEGERLRLWAREALGPGQGPKGAQPAYRESFAWVTIPLFDASVTGGVGGFGSAADAPPSGPGSGSAPASGPNGAGDFGAPGGKAMTYELGGPPVQIDIPSLHRAKECYTEDQVLDPKRKVHKPVRVSMRLEVERLPSSTGAATGPANPGSSAPSKPWGADDREREREGARGHSQRGDFGGGAHRSHASVDQLAFLREGGMGGPGEGGPSGGPKGSLLSRRNSLSRGSFGSELDGIASALGQRSMTAASRLLAGFHAIDLTDMSKAEPFTKMQHFCFLYPQAISLTKKHNLLIRVELRPDDLSLKAAPMEAFCPKKPGALLRSATSQVVSGQRPALFHDEFKLQLPAIVQPQHHFLFTVLHTDLTLQGKHLTPPVPVGYAILPLTAAIQAQKSELNLPLYKELLPKYLQESVKARMGQLEEGRGVFKLRSRLFSTIYPISEKVRAFFREYDRHVSEASLPGPELLDSINSLKTVDIATLLHFLYPVLNMLLCMIGNGVETLQVAAFRAMVNIISRVQAESSGGPLSASSGQERNKFLVHFVDYIFDDLGRQQAPVYPGLSNVWRSLARSKAKGYRVGPVYSEALVMSWFILELVVKSMDLELAQVPQGDEIARLRLENEVFQCIWQLFECLLCEIQDRADSDFFLAKRISTSVSFFCYDLVSVVDPPQVFELVGMFMTKFAGMCSPALQGFKLSFLRIVCDHDFYVETPGRVPIEKNYMTTVLLKELFVSLDHEDQQQRATAAKMLCFLITKHEFDERYQAVELKLYIAQLYFPIINMILDEIPVFDSLAPMQKRLLLPSLLTIIRNLDDDSLLKCWKQSEARTHLFFLLLRQAVILFQYKGEYYKRLPSKVGPDGKSTPGALPPPDADAADMPPAPLLFSDRLAPEVSDRLEELSQREPKSLLSAAASIQQQQSTQQALQENALIRRHTITGSSSSPLAALQGSTAAHPAAGGAPGTGAKGGAVYLREVVGRSRPSPWEALVTLRNSLPPSLQTTVLAWEASMASWMSLEVLELLEKFSELAAEQAVATSYDTMDCLTGPLWALLAVPQPASFWAPFLPVLARMLQLHGAPMLGPGKERVVKDIVACLMRGFYVRPEFVRRRAILTLLLILRNTMRFHSTTHRLKVVLTMALSEVLAQMRLLERTGAGRGAGAGGKAGEAGGGAVGLGDAVESPEVDRLRYSLEEMAAEETWLEVLEDCGLPAVCLQAAEDDKEEDEEEDEEDEGMRMGGEDGMGGLGEYEGAGRGRRRRAKGHGMDGWRWEEVRDLQETLLTVIDAASQHAQLLDGVKQSGDRYAVVESFYILAQAYGHVPDLYIMWMLHLCDAHQEMQQWAEAGQCCVAVASIVIRALQGLGTSPWGKEQLEVLFRVCPLARHQWRAKSCLEGFGASSLSAESGVKYLHMASSFFSRAELFHFCADLLALALPAYHARRDYPQLSKGHTSLAAVYESIVSQEGSPIPFKDASYYRVGFYGDRFGYVNGREFIYREPRSVRLGDIVEKLSKLYEAKSGAEEPLHIIQDSREVEPAALKPGFVYMQITAVEPVVGEGEEKWMARGLPPSAAGAPIFGCFMFDTPFTEAGKAQGRMEEQWKRRTLLYTQSTLPSLISRQPVVRSEVREYSPVECAVEVIDSRTHALETEINAYLAAGREAATAAAASGGQAAAAAAAFHRLSLPRLQTLQRLLQGSVALQVNSGVLGVCMAFYKPSTDGSIRPKEGSKLLPHDLEELTATIVHFVLICKKAIAVHGRAMKDDDRDFQDQLVQSFEDLVIEIASFIPGIRKRVSSM